MPAIETEALTKKYDSLVAVDSVSLKVEEGELFGLLGPNGAGKTTLIHMLSTITHPTEGTARVWGFDIKKDASKVRASIGMVFQDTTLDDRLTGRENLDLHGRLYGLKSERKKRIEDVLALVELTERADMLVKTYSGGMMRRLEIARGLMHHPHVLFLDEPTLGLDPQTRVHIWEYIRKMNREEGVTLILTTHYMEEAEALCDRVAIIDYGKIVAIDSPDNLKSELGGDVITLTVGDEDTARAMCDVYRGKDCRVSSRGSTVHITVQNGERRIPQILQLAAEANVRIESVSLRKPTLEDVFLHYTGHAIREESISEIGRWHYLRSTRRK